MKLRICCILIFCFVGVGLAQLKITSLTKTGSLTVTNAFPQGVVTVNESTNSDGPWVPVQSQFTTARVATVKAPVPVNTAFYRASAVDLAGGRAGFTNLVYSYDLITALAGAGGAPDNGLNKWSPAFEGAPATNVLLSRPHIAMADQAGNVYIADKFGYAIRKVRPDGILVTVAGTNGPGNGPDTNMPGTQVALNQPNGLWVRADGTVYILDLQNAKVRRLAPDGMLKTLFSVPGGILAGRGLWVRDDEGLAYFCSGFVVRKWTPAGGVTDYATGFFELANLVVDPWGNVVVTDRDGHRVWRLADDGTKVAIAGNGTTSGGGDGARALDTGLEEVRGIWFLPTGAYFLCTHRGSQIWYVDTEGIIHLFLNGERHDAHAGDGTWFYNPAEWRVSEVRAITLDYAGNLIITENDRGYIRRVHFLPHRP